MHDDDSHDTEDPREDPRNSRRYGRGERSRRRHGGLFDSALFDLAPIDRVLRDITSWFDDELQSRQGSGRKPHRGDRARGRSGGFGDAASGRVHEQQGDASASPGGRGDHRGEPDDRGHDYDDEDEARPGSLRGRGPKNYRRSDERVRELISDVLYDDELLDASDIEVSVVGGEVTLSGFVVSRRDKHRAENLAARIAYARDVDNRLRVRRSAGEEPVGAAPGGLPGDAERDADDYGHSG